jgi:hypothetical protein
MPASIAARLCSQSVCRKSSEARAARIIATYSSRCSASKRIRLLGWTLAAFLVLFGGLIVLTQGSGGVIYDDRFYFRDDKNDRFPDGGLELAVVPGDGIARL